MEQFVTQHSNLIYWSIVVGLFSASVWVLVAGATLVTFMFRFAGRARTRQTYEKLARVLYEVAVRNDETNPDLANLARLMIGQMIPDSELFNLDDAAVRRQLGLESLDEIEARAHGRPVHQT